jgi:hypothetical protein
MYILFAFASFQYQAGFPQAFLETAHEKEQELA